MMMDLKEQRMWEPSGGIPALEQPIVSTDQWLALNDVLTKVGTD